MGVGCSCPEMGQGLLRGAVREGSLEEEEQSLKSSAKWSNLPPETIKQPLLAGPMSLTPESGGSPQLPPETGVALGLGDTWFL